MYPLSFVSTVAVVAATAAALSVPFDPVSASTEPTTRLVLDDAAGDAWISFESSWSPVPAGDVPEADVLQAHVAHLPTKVLVTLEFDDLQMTDSQQYGATILTPTVNANVNLDAHPSDWDGTVLLTVGRDELLDPEGVTHQIDYETDTVAITIPRSYLRRPDWVRAVLWNDLTRRTDGVEQRFSDNPHNDQDNLAAWPTVKAFHPPTERRSEVALTDSSGDVWTDGPGWEPAPDVVTVDTVQAVVSHRLAALVVRFRMRDLQRVDDVQNFSFIARTSKGLRLANVYLTSQRRTGRHSLVNGMFQPVACSGFSHEVDYDADLVAMRVPARCLGDPSWVRLSLQSDMFPAGDEGSYVEVMDNPHNATPEGAFTPRIHRPTS